MKKTFAALLILCALTASAAAPDADRTDRDCRSCDACHITLPPDTIGGALQRYFCALKRLHRPAPPPGEIIPRH